MNDYRMNECAKAKNEDGSERLKNYVPLGEWGCYLST